MGIMTDRTGASELFICGNQSKMSRTNGISLLKACRIEIVFIRTDLSGLHHGQSFFHYQS